MGWGRDVNVLVATREILNDHDTMSYAAEGRRFRLRQGFGGQEVFGIQRKAIITHETMSPR